MTLEFLLGKKIKINTQSTQSTTTTAPQHASIRHESHKFLGVLTQWNYTNKQPFIEDLPEHKAP
jgi:hypothetical protein